jgi:hypothetical protein
MRLKLAIGFAALTVGAALASVPAVAQQQGVSGYSSRGAVVAIHPYRHHRLYNYAPQRARGCRPAPSRHDRGICRRVCGKAAPVRAGVNSINRARPIS